MKVFAISRDKQFFKIGEDTNSAQWYSYADNVANFIKSINVDDEVSLKAAKNPDGKLVITFIKKGASGNRPQQGPASSSVPGSPSSTPNYQAQSEYQQMKNPEEADFIKRQAIGHMVSRALIALQGQVDLTNIDSVIKQLYTTFKTEVDNA